MKSKILNSDIPVFRPLLPSLGQVGKYLKQIDSNQIYSNRGPLVVALESKYASYFNVNSEQVVALNNATLALQGTVAISGIKNWVLPDFTFAASAMAVLNAGGQIILNDVDPNDWQINPANLVDNNNIGFMPVMPFGSLPNLDRWKNFKNLIFDAAASLGAGPFDFGKLDKNWFVVFSLHATKVLGAGEGALVVCGSDTNASKLRQWSNFGFNLSRSSEFGGTNAKMPEVSAAYALASYENYVTEEKDWLEIQVAIREEISDSIYSNITLEYPGFNPYWILDCRDSATLNRLQSKLQMAGIQSRKWWPEPLHKMPGIDFTSKSKFEISKSLSSRLLGVPKFRGIQRRQIGAIAENILKH